MSLFFSTVNNFINAFPYGNYGRHGSHGTNGSHGRCGDSADKCAWGGRARGVQAKAKTRASAARAGRKLPVGTPALPAMKPAGRLRRASLSYFVRIFALFMSRSAQEAANLDEKLAPTAPRNSVASLYFHACFYFDYSIIVEFRRKMNFACCLLRPVEQVHK